jgi:hypothetical protein
MKPIKWKEGEDYLWKSLGIEQERAEEIEYRIKLILHDAVRPVKDPEDSPGSDVIIKLFLALAQNQEELILCAYLAGTQIPKIYNTEEDEYEFDEWDEEED